MTTITLADIQEKAKALSASRDTITALFISLDVQLKRVQAEKLPDIRRAARKVAKQHEELKALIEAAPELFAKPRTQVVDGLKFGMKKQVGAMTWPDDEKLCARIRKLAADEVITEGQVELLIKVTEKPVAKALEKLEGTVLKRLGVEIGKDSDAVVIASVDGEVEKAVKALIADMTKDQSAPADL